MTMFDFEPILKPLRDFIETHTELLAFNLLNLARPCVRVVSERVDQSRLDLGESRIGGIPDLPVGMEWPRWQPPEYASNKYGELLPLDSPVPLGFIAQIDLLSMPRVDDSLPSTGWLYFFYDRSCEPWGFDPNDRGSCRVLYVDCDRTALVRTPPPADTDPEYVAHSCRVKVDADYSLPRDLEGIEFGTPVFDIYNEFYYDQLKHGHQLLGYPREIQNPMERECQLASNGIDCGGRGLDDDQFAEALTLADGASDWQLLLQIDSDDAGPGWMWGDSGKIYFWIKRGDLASRQFENVWLVLQCY